MPQRFTRAQITKLVADARAANEEASRLHNEGLMQSLEKWVWWCELRARAGFRDLIAGHPSEKLPW